MTDISSLTRFESISNSRNIIRPPSELEPPTSMIQYPPIDEIVTLELTYQSYTGLLQDRMPQHNHRLRISEHSIIARIGQYMDHRPTPRLPSLPNPHVAVMSPNGCHVQWIQDQESLVKFETQKADSSLVHPVIARSSCPCRTLVVHHARLLLSYSV